MNTGKLVSIAGARSAMDVATAAREAAARSSVRELGRRTLRQAELTVADLTNAMTTEGVAIARVPQPLAWWLAVLAGVASAVVEAVALGKAPVLVGLLGMILAATTVASAQWDSGRYPRSRVPVHVVLPVVVGGLGAAAIALVSTPAALLAWAAATVGATGLALQQSYSAWQLRRDQIARELASARAEVHRAWVEGTGARAGSAPVMSIHGTRGEP